MANRWGIPKDVEAAVRARDLACVYCGVRFGGEQRTRASWEHIINDIRQSSADNVALCCVGCNASKGNRRLQDWLMSANVLRRGVTEGTVAPVVHAALKALRCRN